MLLVTLTTLIMMTPPQAPPVQAPAVDSLQAPLPDRDPKPRPKPKPTDAYKLKSFDEAIDMVLQGHRVALSVGVPDLAEDTYQYHVRVGSGFRRIADGHYECRKSADGKAMMHKLNYGPLGTPGVAPVVPFGQSLGLSRETTTPTIGAITVVAPLQSYPAAAPYRGLTGIHAYAGTRGITNSCST